jgi:SH3-like domain-containing protein
MRQRLGGVLRLAAGALLAAVVMVAPRAAIAQVQPASPPAAEAPGAVKGSGLPVPRFVSLKSDRVNVRQGPGTDYPAAWVFRRAGLPVEVIQEFETWRKVRDADGTTGWVLGSLLSGRRTALVLPWEIKPGAPLPQVAIRSGRSGNARTLAMIEAGVIADISSCDGRWCSVAIGSYSGYVEQKLLWGVYENETVR